MTEPTITIKSNVSANLERDYQIFRQELALKDELHPTSLIDIPQTEGDKVDQSITDAAARYEAARVKGGVPGDEIRRYHGYA